MHTHLPVSVVQFLYTECVVEVFCVLRVYCASEHIPEVFSFLIILLCDFASNFVGSILYVFRILVWQSVLG